MGGEDFGEEEVCDMNISNLTASEHTEGFLFNLHFHQTFIIILSCARGPDQIEPNRVISRADGNWFLSLCRKSRTENETRLLRVFVHSSNRWCVCFLCRPAEEIQQQTRRCDAEVRW